MTMKQVIQLDASGYIIGTSVADESPLEPGVFLIPARCVDATMPSIPAGQRAKWSGAQFVLEPVPVDTPAPVPTIEQRRAAVWERIKSERETRRQSGVLASGHWFHSNDTSRIQQIGLVMMGAGIPPGLMWRTMDNGEVPMTQALAGAIFQAVAASDSAHFEAAKVLRAQVEASNDPESIDITTGWPAIYEA